MYMTVIPKGLAIEYTGQYQERVIKKRASRRHQMYYTKSAVAPAGQTAAVTLVIEHTTAILNAVKRFPKKMLLKESAKQSFK
jgi:phosphoribosyl-ATP pyrophosphohydrolase